MREMKPLMLPKLVATRNQSDDLSSEPLSSMYSLADSGFYSQSECSTPPTPGLSTRHLRNPSSTSSLSSSPPTKESFDLLPNASGKLPKLTEEPVERDDDYIVLDRCSYDRDCCAHQPSTALAPVFGATFDYDACDVLHSDADLHKAKRRCSGELPTPSFSNKIESKFPSLSRKVRERKRASTFGTSSRSATPSRVPSRAASIRGSSTRSSSITSSIHQLQGFDLYERFSAPAQSSREHLDEIVASSPIDIGIPKSHPMDAKTNQEDHDDTDERRFARTPLLPPLLVKARVDGQPSKSPLESPKIATANQSLVATPIGTPPSRAYPTPPLSTRPSMASFHTSRPGHCIPSQEIPPIMLTDPNDKWAEKLGHANFTILPEPYIPDVCNAASLRQLFADWEQARCNFTKHLVRTGEHYGVTSKHYMLTEQKWAEIDDLWRTNNDLAISRAAALGTNTEPASPMEPAPLSKMPSLNDPKSEGKFPKLGDEDIVGPMVQFAAQVQKQKAPSRKRAFIQFFRDIKFPASFLRRSSDLPRH